MILAISTPTHTHTTLPTPTTLTTLTPLTTLTTSPSSLTFLTTLTFATLTFIAVVRFAEKKLLEPFMASTFEGVEWATTTGSTSSSSTSSSTTTSTSSSTSSSGSSSRSSSGSGMSPRGGDRHGASKIRWSELRLVDDGTTSWMQPIITKPTTTKPPTKLRTDTDTDTGVGVNLAMGAGGAPYDEYSRPVVGAWRRVDAGAREQQGQGGQGEGEEGEGGEGEGGRRERDFEVRLIIAKPPHMGHRGDEGDAGGTVEGACGPHHPCRSLPRMCTVEVTKSSTSKKSFNWQEFGIVNHWQQSVP